MTDHAMHPPAPKAMTGGLAAVIYGTLSYLLFLGTFLYAIAFVGNMPVPKTIDSGAVAPLPAIADRQPRCCCRCSPSSTA